jgi:ribosome-binding factor A
MTASVELPNLYCPPMITSLGVSKLSIRLERVAHLLKAEISDVLRERLRDPRIGFVTVTDVEVSKDLRHAKVFVSIYGDKDTQKRSLEGLESATNFVRQELAQRIKLRYIPALIFSFDPSVEHADRVARILNELYPNEQDDLPS